MGTRADFYVGRGEKAEWIGSIAWDGYPEPYVAEGLFTDCDEATWRKRVADFLSKRDDATQVADGWPWPWEDSGLTDYSYAFDSGKVHLTIGDGWLAVDEYLRRSDEHRKAVKAYDAAVSRGEDAEAPNDEWWEELNLPRQRFPNMKAVQKVTYGQRSGVLLIGVPK